MRHLKSRRRGNRGFTLVEVVISMAILMIIGVSAIGSVIYTRQAMELNKQQLAALNYARQSLERVSSLGNISGGTVTLVPFNAPGLEIDAEVVTTFYPFFGDGSVDWDTPALVVNNEDASMQLTALDQGKPYLCHVSVNWIPSGSWSRQQTVSIQSIVRRGVR